MLKPFVFLGVFCSLITQSNAAGYKLIGAENDPELESLGHKIGKREMPEGWQVKEQKYSVSVHDTADGSAETRGDDLSPFQAYLLNIVPGMGSKALSSPLSNEVFPMVNPDIRESYKVSSPQMQKAIQFRFDLDETVEHPNMKTRVEVKRLPDNKIECTLVRSHEKDPYFYSYINKVILEKSDTQ